MVTAYVYNQQDNLKQRSDKMSRILKDDIIRFVCYTGDRTIEFTKYSEAEKYAIVASKDRTVFIDLRASAIGSSITSTLTKVRQGISTSIHMARFFKQLPKASL
jgi:hypothetical protein